MHHTRKRYSFTKFCLDKIFGEYKFNKSKELPVNDKIVEIGRTESSKSTIGKPSTIGAFTLFLDFFILANKKHKNYEKLLSLTGPFQFFQFV